MKVYGKIKTERNERAIDTSVVRAANTYNVGVLFSQVTLLHAVVRRRRRYRHALCREFAVRNALNQHAFRTAKRNCRAVMARIRREELGETVAAL